MAVCGCHAADHNFVSATPTPLVRAILDSNRAEVKRLLDSGANPNEISGIGVELMGRADGVNTPIALASGFGDKGDTEILQLLLNHGADINLSPPAYYETFGAFLPIEYAIVDGQTSVVKFLLRHGANPNLESTLIPSLDIAIVDRDAQIEKLSVHEDQRRFGDTSRIHRWHVYDTIIDLLLNYGASPTLADRRGWNPLHKAAMYCDSGLAEKFIALGVPLDAKDSSGETPEDLAREANCPSVLAVIQRRKK